MACCGFESRDWFWHLGEAGVVNPGARRSKMLTLPLVLCAVVSCDVGCGGGGTFTLSECDRPSRCGWGGGVEVNPHFFGIYLA